MQRTFIDFWVGLFVVVGLTATAFIALQVANNADLNGRDNYQIQANFDNIGDLKVRAPVKSAGVLVGRVSDIKFDPEQHKAVVTVSLDSRYRFSVDSSMSILTTGILGEQYIGIESGAEEDLLSAGDSIWLTSSAVVLENLIGELLYSTRQAAEK